ncbi:MAG: SGNH/GDSL hydrolase family protein, partial [Myxococcota bacterium]
RLTLPVVDANDIVLVAGDSVANGAMLDDSETISSRLQGEDPHRRYVNLGIVGAQTSDIACALERAARRYHGRLRELIYVFCENDFDDATPEEVIAGLVAFAEREQIRQVVLVYMPYIYNVVPEMTRIRGHSHYNYPTYRNEKRALLAQARQAGVAIVDFVDIANDEQRALATQFAPLALYVDHTHPSPRGVQRLVAAIDAARTGPTASPPGD